MSSTAGVKLPNLGRSCDQSNFFPEMHKLQLLGGSPVNVYILPTPNLASPLFPTIYTSLTHSLASSCKIIAVAIKIE